MLFAGPIRNTPHTSTHARSRVKRSSFSIFLIIRHYTSAWLLLADASVGGVPFARMDCVCVCVVLLCSVGRSFGLISKLFELL